MGVRAVRCMCEGRGGEGRVECGPVRVSSGQVRGGACSAWRSAEGARLAGEMRATDQLLQVEEAPTHALYNVVVLGINFLLLFFAFNTIQAFETTLNHSLGFISLATLYTCFSISTLFSGLVVSALGPRLTLFVGAFTYVLFLAANVHVIPAVLIAASAVIGVGAALLWTAQGAFLVANTTPRTLSQRSGLFWAIFQLSGVYAPPARAPAAHAAQVRQHHGGHLPALL